MKHVLAIAALSAALAGQSACFDDPYGHHGGNVIVPDGGEVVTPEARGAGTILVFETEFIDRPELGASPFIVFGPFMSKGQQDAQYSFEEAEGSPFACKIIERTREQYLDRGLDIGTIAIDIDLGGPELPPCRLVSPDIGWACIGVEGTGGDIQLVDGPSNTWSLTNAGTIFGDDEIGRILHVTGAATAGNNGDFPITAVAGQNTVHFTNPAGVEELGTSAEYGTFAGRGPAGQPASVSDLAEGTVSLTPGPDTDSRYKPFSNEKIQFGDEFTPDDASVSVFTNFPMNGSEVNIGCNGAGGNCGRASASSVDIETTDAPLPPEGPSLGIEMGLPIPATKSVQLLCIFLTGKVVIPAEASQYIADSGATRIRTVYLRADVNDVIQDGSTTTMVAGHAVAGLTDVE